MSERVTVGLMLQQVQVLSHLFYICVCICVYICVCVCVCICVCLCGCICTRISLCICVCICTCICICICLCLCDSSKSAVQTSASSTSTTLHIPTYLPSSSWASLTVRITIKPEARNLKETEIGPPSSHIAPDIFKTLIWRGFKHWHT